MADFETALAITLRQEVGDDPNGAYTETPGDAGRATKWGISQRAYPNLNIRNLTKDQAADIYLSDYWNANQYGLIMDQGLANKMFDMSVNMGQPEANGLLQEALGLKVDRIIGPVTLKAANNSDPVALTQKLRQLQEDHYRLIAQKNPADEQFLEDWLGRAQAV